MKHLLFSKHFRFSTNFSFLQNLKKIKISKICRNSKMFQQWKIRFNNIFAKARENVLIEIVFWKVRQLHHSSQCTKMLVRFLNLHQTKCLLHSVCRGFENYLTLTTCLEIVVKECSIYTVHSTSYETNSNNNKKNYHQQS